MTIFAVCLGHRRDSHDSGSYANSPELHRRAKRHQSPSSSPTQIRHTSLGPRRDSLEPRRNSLEPRRNSLEPRRNSLEPRRSNSSVSSAIPPPAPPVPTKPLYAQEGSKYDVELRPIRPRGELYSYVTGRLVFIHVGIFEK